MLVIVSVRDGVSWRKRFDDCNSIWVRHSGHGDENTQAVPAGDRVLATCVDANGQGRKCVQGGLRLKTVGDLIGRHVRQRPPPPLRLTNGIYAARAERASDVDTGQVGTYVM